MSVLTAMGSYAVKATVRGYVSARTPDADWFETEGRGAGPC